MDVAAEDAKAMARYTLSQFCQHQPRLICTKTFNNLEEPDVVFGVLDAGVLDAGDKTIDHDSFVRDDEGGPQYPCIWCGHCSSAEQVYYGHLWCQECKPQKAFPNANVIRYPTSGRDLLTEDCKELACTSRARQFKHLWTGWIGLLPLRTSVWEVRGWMALGQLCQVCVFSLVRFLQRWMRSLHEPIHLQGALSTWVCQALLMTKLEIGPLPLQWALSTQACQVLLVIKLETFLRMLGPLLQGQVLQQRLLLCSQPPSSTISTTRRGNAFKRSLSQAASQEIDPAAQLRWWDLRLWALWMGRQMMMRRK